MVLKRLARGGLMKGKTIGVDSTTVDANAAMKSIVRRDTQESYGAYLEQLAEAEGLEAKDAAAVRRMDRKRSKKMRKEEWVNPNDPEAEITRLKDARHGAGLQSRASGGYGKRSDRGGDHACGRGRRQGIDGRDGGGGRSGGRADRRSLQEACNVALLLRA